MEQTLNMSRKTETTYLLDRAGVAGTLAILTEFFETGSRVAIQQLELVRMAHHFRTIDSEILER